MLNSIIAILNLRSTTSCLKFAKWDSEKFSKKDRTRRWKKFNNWKTIIIELTAYILKQSNSNRALLLREFQSKNIFKNLENQSSHYQFEEPEKQSRHSRVPSLSKI